MAAISPSKAKKEITTSVVKGMTELPSGPNRNAMNNFYTGGKDFDVNNHIGVDATGKDVFVGTLMGNAVKLEDEARAQRYMDLILMNQAFDINNANAGPDGQTALMVAIESRKLSRAMRLLNWKIGNRPTVDVNIVAKINGKRTTALDLAKIANDKTLIDALVNKGALGAKDVPECYASFMSGLPPEFAKVQADFYKSLTPAEKAALKYYVGDGYEIVNAILRSVSNEEFDTFLNDAEFRAKTIANLKDNVSKLEDHSFIVHQKLDELITGLANVIKTAPALPFPMSVFRGMNVTAYNAVREHDDDEESGQLLPVKSLENGLLSTSYDRDVAEFRYAGAPGKGCCVMTYCLDQGVRVIYAEPFGIYPGEKEIIVIPPYMAVTKPVEGSKRYINITLSPRAAKGGRTRRMKPKRKRTYRKKSIL